MKNFSFLGRLSVLVVMFAFGSLAAMAGGNAYYSKVTVKSTGNGMVYVSYNENKTPSEYAEEMSAESGRDVQGYEAPTHTYYIYAQPVEGYVLKGWYTDEDCTSGFTSSDNVKIVAGKDVANEVTYYAKFVLGVYANLTIKAGKYGSFVAPFDVTLPEGVTAYSVTINEDKAELTEFGTNNGVLPAGNPVIVKSDVDVNESYFGVPSEEVSVTKNGLVGFYQSGTDVPVGAYVLQTQNDEQGFYKVGSTTVNGVKNRCYLPAPESTEAHLRIVLEGAEEATAVNSVSTTATPAEYYSANGVKVAAPQNGINIVKMTDGSVKKMIVK